MAGAGVAATGAGAASRPSPLRSKLLTASQLGQGWTGGPISNKPSGATPSCFKPFDNAPGKVTKAKADFQQSGGIPQVGESLMTGPGTIKHLNAANNALSTCKTVSFKSSGHTLKGTITPISTFPNVGDKSVAYAMTVKVQNQTLGVDIVLFQVGRYGAAVLYMDQGTPSAETVAGIANQAAANLQ